MHHDRPAMRRRTPAAHHFWEILSSNRNETYRRRGGHNHQWPCLGTKRRSTADCPRGPFTITEVIANGTVKIQCGAYANLVSIRRITPYFERDN